MAAAAALGGAGNEGLRERELRKRALLCDAITDGFLARGVNELDARPLSEMTGAVFRISIDRWLDDPEPGLVAILNDTMAALTAVTR